MDQASKLSRSPLPRAVKRGLLPLAAVVALLAYLSVRHPTLSVAQGVPGSPPTVLIDGVPVPAIEGVEIDGVASDVLWNENPLTGQMHTRPGNHKPGKMTVTKDWSNTSEWRAWRQAINDGKTDRRSISVIFHNDAGEEAGRVNLYNCWPRMYSGPNFNARNSGHATEKLDIVYEQITYK